ncbi:MAG: FMN-binding glutamate synthase family protein, partial [Xanthomonadales bacterium]|nr:FMN-binding glutamate synthase family protein [Xanthomonadales bacterium]
LSQGAKPGGGGILPGRKVTPEIAEARGVPVGKDVHSPPGFDEFDTPQGLLEFVARLRELSGGKPVGFKLCVGRPREFFGILKAMRETGIRPDYITVDGSEGGTGAAPPELSDGVGLPLREGLVFVHNALVGADLRDEIRVIASGKVIHGLDLAAKLAMGADLCNSARGFMFALGCIQARACNRNICPTGITTMDPWRVHGLVVEEKAKRVANYHRGTIKHFLKVLGACGLEDPSQLEPEMLNRRISPTEVRNYRELYAYLAPGQLLSDPDSTAYAPAWAAARPDAF